MQNKKIVFFDGECGFCNKSIRFILKNRRSNDFLFIALQSKQAEDILKKFTITIDMSTLYVMENDIIKEKSEAILSLVSRLKWFWFWLKLGYLVPLKWRNYIYDIIAKRRHTLASDFCYIPNIEEKKMFL